MFICDIKTQVSGMGVGDGVSTAFSIALVQSLSDKASDEETMGILPFLPFEGQTVKGTTSHMLCPTKAFKAKHCLHVTQALTKAYTRSYEQQTI